MAVNYNNKILVVGNFNKGLYKKLEKKYNVNPITNIFGKKYETVISSFDCNYWEVIENIKAKKTIMFSNKNDIIKEVKKNSLESSCKSIDLFTFNRGLG